VTEPTYTQASARFVRETEPTDEAVARLRDRLDREVGTAGSVKDVAGDALGPPAGAAARVTSRLRDTRRRRRWSPGWFGPGPVSPWRAPIALAAAVVIAWVLLRPAPEEPAPVVAPVEPPPAPAVEVPEVEPDVPPTDAAVEVPEIEIAPAPPEASAAPPSATEPERAPLAPAPEVAEPDAVVALDAVGENPLSSFGAWTSASPDPRVRLRYRGEGVLDAGGDDFEVRWETGRIEVDVDPKSGVRLAVVTAEARVSIVGTAFSVQTDFEGTRVDVRSGTVRVVCADGEPRDATAGVAVDCATRDPRKLVAHAVALYNSEGRSCGDVLRPLDEGLDQWPADGPDRVFGAALWIRVLCLDELDRRHEAKAAAEHIVELGLPGHLVDARRYLARWGSP